MTLEEAIKFCEIEAHRIELKNGSEWMQDLQIKESAKRFRQLAEWLRELVHLRNITEYLRDMVTCFEFMDSMHYNEDIIEWADSELSVDMREVNADEDSD